MGSFCVRIEFYLGVIVRWTRLGIYFFISLYIIYYMKTIEVPRELQNTRDLVVVSRKKYEDLLDNSTPVVNLTKIQSAKLDRVYKEFLRDKKAGKIKVLRSLEDLR